MSDNTANNKRIAKNTVFLYFRSIIMLSITLYTSRVMLRTLGVENYGIYNIVGGFVTMFTMISGTLASASQRFITFSLGEGDKLKVKKVFETSVTLHLVLGAILVVLLEILGIWFLNNKMNIPEGRMFAANMVMHCSIAALFFRVMAVPYNALIIAHEKMQAFAYISIIDAALQLLAAYVLPICKYDRLIVYSILILSITVSLRLLYSFYSRIHFEEAKHIKYKIHRGLFGRMFSFAGWNLLGQGSMLLRNQGVDVLLNMFYGVALNAAKGVSGQVQKGVMQLVNNFTTALRPQITKAMAQKDYTRVSQLVNQGTRYSFYMLQIFTVPLIITIPDVLSIWLEKVPEWTVQFVRWSFIYLLLDSQSKLLTHGILSTGKIRNYQIIAGGTKLFAIPVAYLIFFLGGEPLTGIYVNIGLEIICLMERLYYANKMFCLDIMSYIKRVIFSNWFNFLIALIPCLVIKHILTVSFIPNLIFSGFVTTIIIWYLGLKRNERSLLTLKVSGIIRKIRK